MLGPQFPVQKLFGGWWTADVNFLSLDNYVHQSCTDTYMGTSLIRSRVLDEPTLIREQQTLRDTGRKTTLHVKNSPPLPSMRILEVEDMISFLLLI